MRLTLDKGSLPGLAALAALALTVAALAKRRFRIGYFLFHVAVALGERWKAKRVRRDVAAVVAEGATPPSPAEPPT